MEPGVDMGPIYAAEHRASIIESIDKGVAEGAELVVDGRSFTRRLHELGGTNESAIGNLAMRGEDGVRFFTQQKTVTERWPEPGRTGPPSLAFPGNS